RPGGPHRQRRGGGRGAGRARVVPAVAPHGPRPVRHPGGAAGGRAGLELSKLHRRADAEPGADEHPRWYVPVDDDGVEKAVAREVAEELAGENGALSSAAERPATPARAQCTTACRHAPGGAVAAAARGRVGTCAAAARR
ncbi:unnamed protein product, partial [Prorocentrum cordatum]